MIVRLVLLDVSLLSLSILGVEAVNLCELQSTLWVELRHAAGRATRFLLLFLLEVGGWANEGENYRQQDEAIGHAEHDDSEPQLEEDFEDVGAGSGEDDNGEESGETTMEDRRTHLGDSYSGLEHAHFLHCATLGSINDEVGVGDMR